MTKIAALAGLHVYRYPKADVSATVVIFFDSGKNALTIVRKHSPFEGSEAFPGGFLNPGQETLRQAARRELQEETSIDLAEEDFLPVDERSETDRDPRGHMIDHGFMVIISDEAKPGVVAQMRAADDASACHIRPVVELLNNDMAFDHRKLLMRAMQQAGFTQTK